MSKLSKEIAKNQAEVITSKDRNEEKKALAQSMLDSISGGWVNAFALWGKSF